MDTLQNANILLGVTGGIAAYKSTELIRRLRDLGANVQVIMTPAAEAFITPLTLQALSGHPVRTSLLDPAAEAGMGHIELARWADLIVITPASADFLARCVHGFANDLLSTVCLAAKCSIALAPAMNQAMWHNPVTQSNMAKIATYSHFKVWGPASGTQACGDVGFGRMLEAEELSTRILDEFHTNSTCQNKETPQRNKELLAGKKVIITAGPTREAIDPVRYISNESSGKMGYALAEAASDAGADVYLISGPTNLKAPPFVKVINVITAKEMASASLELATNADVFIGAAAVADFRPADVATKKIKKGKEETMHITLTKNPDIIASVAALESRPTVIGFAAETDNVEKYAKAKLESKGLDMIVANDVSDTSIGFNSDENAVTLFTKQHSLPLGKAPKSMIAQHIIENIVKHTG